MRFSNNYRDLSEQSGTGAGFQFEFYCSRCSDAWRSVFEPYASARVAGWLNKVVSAAWGVLGGRGYGISNAADGLAGARYGTAHDAAFDKAVSEVESRFNRCARCTHQVCARCWNAAQGLCLNCAPDTAAEALAAQQRGLNDSASERAYAAGQIRGRQFDVTTPRQLVCPRCRTETHGANFCPGCGHHLARQDLCGSCQAPVPQGAAFCPGCGMRREA